MVLSIHHQRYVKLRGHLKALRKAAGLTQAQLAERLGEEQAYISRIELGDRYVDVLFYLDWVRACGHTPSESVRNLEDANVSRTAGLNRVSRHTEVR